MWRWFVRKLRWWFGKYPVEGQEWEVDAIGIVRITQITEKGFGEFFYRFCVIHFQVGGQEFKAYPRHFMVNADPRSSLPIRWDKQLGG